MNILTNLPNELLSLVSSKLDLASRLSLRHVSTVCSKLNLFYPRDTPLYVKWNKMDMILYVCISNSYVELYRWMMPSKNHFITLYAHDHSEQAAFVGCLDILKYIHLYEPDKMISYGNDRIRIMYRAAEGGHLEIIRWLRDIGCPWDDWVCTAATQNGHFDVLKCLRAYGCSWDFWTCAAAAEIGRLDILEWLYYNGCPLDECVFNSATEAGYFDIITWLREKRCPWDEYTCASAADKGHLEILKWLHENGCPWNEVACEYAADSGHLEILQYLHDNDCPR